MQDHVRGALDLTADRRSCMIGGLPMGLELSSAVLRICASSDESLPDPHSIRMIEFKQTDSDTPDGSLRQNVSAISGLATTLLRDDVIRLMGKQHIFVAHEAVLATIGGVFPDQLA